MTGDSVIERAAKVGAAALTHPAPAPMCVGDVLYDHDWTPIEAARAVLEAVNYAEAVADREALAAAARAVVFAFLAGSLARADVQPLVHELDRLEGSSRV